MHTQVLGLSDRQEDDIVHSDQKKDAARKACRED